MGHWIVAILIWHLAGILYGVTIGVDMYGHYAWKYGIELTARALSESKQEWESSWSYVPLNVLLWPYKVTVNAIGMKQTIDDWFEANVQQKKAE